MEAPPLILRSLFQRSLDETRGIADVENQIRTINMCQIWWEFYATYPATLGIVDHVYND